MTPRRTRLAALALATPLALGGCSSLAGLHDAPAEDAQGQSISDSAGAQVTQRVLGEVGVALDAEGKGSAKDRKTVLTGPALEAADAKVDVEQVEGEGAALAPSAEPTVIAVSKGTSWPRTILATSQQDEEQRLHVLVADSPRSQYRLYASVPMAAGATVPALAESDGAVEVPTKVGAKDLQPVARWAKAVSYPAPKSDPKGVAVDDPFSSALRTNAAKQAKRLGDLASYKVSHTPSSDGMVFPLADGGTLTITTLTRTDTISAGEDAKELTLPDELTDLVGEESVGDRLSVRHLETVAVVAPKGGDVTVVGASEQLSSAKGS